MSMDASGPVGPFCRGPACQRGLTLVELLTSLSLGLILTTLAVESYEYQVGEARADEQINRLRTALALARSEAVYRGARVVLCRRQSVSVQCAGASASGRPDWSQGWLVFLDNNNTESMTTGICCCASIPPWWANSCCVGTVAII